MPKYFRIMIPVLISLLLVFSSCIKIVVNDDPVSNTGTTSGLSEDEASIILFNFAVESELAVLQVLESFSDGFTKPILGPGVELSYEDCDTIFGSMATLVEMEDEVMAALTVLVPPEYASLNILSASVMVLPGDTVHYPAGLLGSLWNFFTGCRDAGKKSREKIEKLTINASPELKEQMYNSLRPGFKKGAANADEWFAKLHNGDYDVQANQIHNDFTYGFAEEYGAEAQQQQALPNEHALEQGKQLTTKAIQVYSDAATTILDAGSPGLGTAINNTQTVATKLDQYKNYAKTTYKDGMAAALTQAAKDRLDDQFKVALENTVGSNWADAITHFTAQVTGTDKPSDLVGKAFDSGTVKVTGAGKSSSAQVAIAFNQDDNAKTKMVATVTNTGEPELNVPQGKYIVVATDTAGNKAEKTDVNVTAGQETTVAMQPKSSDDTGGEQQVAAEKPKDEGESFLDTVRILLDAAMAGLNGDNNDDDGTGNGASDGGSSDTAETGNQNDAGVSGNTAPAPTTTPAQATGCWSGRWKTNYAGLTLTQNGSQVTGTYGLMGETMKGTVSGNTFTGTWHNPSSTASTNMGDIELTMSADCNSFTGRWRYNSAVFDLEWDGIWTGTRIAP